LSAVLCHAHNLFDGDDAADLTKPMTKPNRFEPRYELADVADAAGLDLLTLRNWLNPQRGIIVPRCDDLRGSGRGVRRLFSLVRVYQIAITAELVRQGIPVSKAALAALQFSDFGNNEAVWAGEEPGPFREPGELFAEGNTFLCVRDQGEVAHLVEMKGSLNLWEVEPGGEDMTWTVVPVNAVVDRVRRKLRDRVWEKARAAARGSA